MGNISEVKNRILKLRETSQAKPGLLAKAAKALMRAVTEHHKALEGEEKRLFKTLIVSNINVAIEFLAHLGELPLDEAFYNEIVDQLDKRYSKIKSYQDALKKLTQAREEAENLLSENNTSVVAAKQEALLRLLESENKGYLLKILMQDEDSILSVIQWMDADRRTGANVIISREIFKTLLSDTNTVRRLVTHVTTDLQYDEAPDATPKNFQRLVFNDDRYSQTILSLHLNKPKKYPAELLSTLNHTTFRKLVRLTPLTYLWRSVFNRKHPSLNISADELVRRALTDKMFASEVLFKDVLFAPKMWKNLNTSHWTRLLANKSLLAENDQLTLETIITSRSDQQAIRAAAAEPIEPRKRPTKAIPSHAALDDASQPNENANHGPDEIQKQLNELLQKLESKDLIIGTITQELKKLKEGFETFKEFKTSAPAVVADLNRQLSNVQNLIDALARKVKASTFSAPLSHHRRTGRGSPQVRSHSDRRNRGGSSQSVLQALGASSPSSVSLESSELSPIRPASATNISSGTNDTPPAKRALNRNLASDFNADDSFNVNDSVDEALPPAGDSPPPGGTTSEEDASVTASVAATCR